MRLRRLRRDARLRRARARRVGLHFAPGDRHPAGSPGHPDPPPN
jgi:hypothetical protein